MSTRAFLLILLATPAWGSAQEVIEVDYSSGRTIISDEWRAMSPIEVLTDWTRGLLYVHDQEEPNGVMVFSLETGKQIRTILTPRGDGPFEFSQGRISMSLAGDGGLYVSGLSRVISYDSAGVPFDTWTPRAPSRRGVCDLGGKPAVPVPGGVLRHETETIGPGARLGPEIIASSQEEGMALGLAISLARIVCTEDRAIVVMNHDDGPDSVYVYKTNGDADRIEVPTDFAFDDEWTCQIGGKPCPPWSDKLYPSFDDRGNLVLFSADMRTGGTIIDMETGCYAILRKNPLDDMARIPVRIRGDSVMIFEQDSGDKNGKRQLFMGSTNKVSLHPLRRTSDEPCPGILPSVR